MNKVGIGVLTTPERMKSIPIERNYLNRKGDALFLVHCDEDHRGPAHGRNQLLSKMMDADCDYLFLFDDDCYPIMSGWEDYFIDNCDRHNIHYCGLPNVFKSIPLWAKEELQAWDGCVGCFSFQTRAFMEQVGYFNQAYDRYGFEDAGRAIRAIRSGLSGGGLGRYEYLSLIRAPAYIKSLDVYGVNPPLNLTKEEKDVYIKRNHWHYEMEIKINAPIYYTSHGKPAVS